MPNTNPFFLKLPFRFDKNRLLESLQQIDVGDWVSHPNVNAYKGGWLATSLRSTTGKTKEIVAIEEHTYQDTPLLKKSPYIQELLKTFQTTIEAVRYMNLRADSIIQEHCDRGSCYDDGLIRIHIPITTNDKVAFNLNGESHNMQIGECYYIDANTPHSVKNLGDSDRVHLLIDCHVNEWVEAIFQKSGFEKQIYKYGDKSITDDNVEMIIQSFKEINTPTSLTMAKRLEDIQKNI